MPDPTDYGTWQTPPYFDPNQQQAANVPYSYGPTVVPGSLAGGYGYDPNAANRQAFWGGLTNAGLGLLAASSPSPYPFTVGTAFGGLAGGFASGVQQGRQQYYQNQMQAAQAAQMAYQQQALQQYLNTPTPQQPQQAQTPDATNPGNPAAPMPTGSPQQLNQAMNYFQSIGLSKEQAAGLVGNMFEESRFNPNAINPHDGSDGSDSIGVMQWNGPRYKALQQFAKDNNLSPADFQTQLQFIGQEFKTTHRDQFEKIKAANTVEQATDAALHYLTPGIDQKTADKYLVNRQRFAQNAYGGQSAGGGTSAADYPQPNPQVLARARQMMGSGVPFLMATGKNIEEGELKRVEQEQKKYEANIKLRQQGREEEKLALEKQKMDPAYLAEKKRVETEGQEQARTGILFGSKDWQKQSPDDLRKSVNPELLSVTESVQSGRTPLSAVNQTRASNGISFSKNEVTALGEKLYGEDWDPQGGDRRQKFENDTTDTSSQTGKTLASVNTVYKHIARFQDAYDRIGNGDTPFINALRKHYFEATGKDTYTTPEALQHALATEVANVIKGAQLNEPEVESALDTIETTKSPAQMHGALGIVRHAMGDRESTIMNQAARAKMPANRAQQLIDPDAKAAIQGFDQKQAAFAQQQEQSASQDALKKAQSNTPLSVDEARRLPPATSFIGADGIPRVTH